MKPPLMLVVLTLLLQPYLKADTFCGTIISKNGLNVRTGPGLDTEVIYGLNFDDQFALVDFAAEGRADSLIDNGELIKGEWVEIELYPFREGKNNLGGTGFIFNADKYVKYHDCNDFQDRLYEHDLYVYAKAYDERSKAFEDSVRTIYPLELIGPRNEVEEYDFKKIFSVDEKDFFLSKGKDTLSVPLSNGETKEIINYPFGKPGLSEDYREEYEYLGYNEFLDQFLIFGSYYESWDVQLFNKSDGKVSARFGLPPIISNDYKYAIELDHSVYENYTFLNISKLYNGKFETIYSYTFEKWAYAGNPKWLSNNELIFKVCPIFFRDKPIDIYDEETNRYQYLKLILPND